MKPTFIEMLSLGLVCIVTQAYAAPPADYVDGRRHWDARRWSDASPPLARHRVQTGETFDVDYMLGTAWCRIPGKLRPGWSMLDWAVHNYPLERENLLAFTKEREDCRLAIAQAQEMSRQPAAIAGASSVPSSGIASGKVYYVAKEGIPSLNAYPLAVKRPIAAAELERRLVPLEERDRALSIVRGLVPDDVKLAMFGRFILASESGHTEAQMRQLGERLEHYLAFLNNEYGIKPGQYFITVYLVPRPELLQKAALGLHGLDASPYTLGYAFQNDQSIVAVLNGTAAGTLLHEFFHLAVRASFGAIPQWLDEGLASLYETTSVVGANYLGEPNWRSDVVNQLRGGMGAITLRKVIAAPWFTDQPGPAREQHWDVNEQMYALGIARYFVMFLQQQGQLKAVFHALRNHESAEFDELVPAGDKAVLIVERTVGKPIQAMEAEFWHWYEKNAAKPTARLYQNSAFEQKEIPTEIRREIPKELQQDTANPLPIAVDREEYLRKR